MEFFQWVQIGIAILQFAGIPILIWIARILQQIHRGNKLTTIKVESLIITLAMKFRDDDFMECYNDNLEKKKADYNFIYKEK